VRKLHLVGYTPDHKGLILTARRGSKSGGYVVPLGDALLDIVAEEQRRRGGDSPVASPVELEPVAVPVPSSDLPEPRARLRSSLTPREIQARLRAGRSIAEVAAEARVDREWVERFAVPILAEQAQIVELARALVYVKPRRGESSAPLGRSVVENLIDRGVGLGGDAFEAAWSARQVHDAVWEVILRYRSRGRDQQAVWEIDVANARLTSRNRLASDLGHLDPARQRPIHPPDADGIHDDTPGTEAPPRSGRRRSGAQASKSSASRSRTTSARASRPSSSRTRPVRTTTAAKGATAARAPKASKGAKGAKASRFPPVPKATKATITKAAKAAAVAKATKPTTTKVTKAARVPTARTARTAKAAKAAAKSPRTPETTSAAKAIKRAGKATAKAAATKASAAREAKAAARSAKAPKAVKASRPTSTAKATKAGPRANKAAATTATTSPPAEGAPPPSLNGSGRRVDGAHAAAEARLPGRLPVNRLASNRVAANRAAAGRLSGDRRAANPVPPPDGGPLLAPRRRPAPLSPPAESRPRPMPTARPMAAATVRQTVPPSVPRAQQPAAPSPGATAANRQSEAHDPDAAVFLDIDDLLETVDSDDRADAGDRRPARPVIAAPRAGRPLGRDPKAAPLRPPGSLSAWPLGAG
jgi:hypothetical protein